MKVGKESKESHELRYFSFFFLFPHVTKLRRYIPISQKASWDTTTNLLLSLFLRFLVLFEAEHQQ